MCYLQEGLLRVFRLYLVLSFSAFLGTYSYLVFCMSLTRLRIASRDNTWFVFSTSPAWYLQHQIGRTRLTQSLPLLGLPMEVLNSQTMAEVRPSISLHLYQTHNIGLQCHTAPNTWKLVFEHKHRLHEIILSACSSQEEDVWKTQLRQRITCETQDFVEGQPTMQEMFSCLMLDVKSLGPVFGHADSMVRRMSVHRAATLGAKTNLSQVIIKNTQAEKLQQSPPTFSPGVVARSQSLLSSNHIPTLAPRRAERIRLENAMEDVWTKDALPFPGMSNRRVEDQIRASANSVMRKLSMASIASNFSRRSPSFSSMSNSRSEDSYGSRVHKVSQGNLRAHPAKSRRPTPAVVDFHNAPAAFLPVDFELEDTRPIGRSRRAGPRGGGQWSSDSSVSGRPKRTRRLSTHIIRLPRSESNARLTARASSNGSNATVLHVLDPPRDVGMSPENGKPNEKDRDRTTRAGHFASMPMKKFSKSKSRIFKFWT